MYVLYLNVGASGQVATGLPYQEAFRSSVGDVDSRLVRVVNVVLS